MNWKNSILVIFFLIKILMSDLSSSEIEFNKEVLDQEGVKESRSSAVFDPLKHLILPTLYACKQMTYPLNVILFDSLSTKIINGVEIQFIQKGFLPFYTNFWCTGARFSLEFFANILYAGRDCQIYGCSLDDTRHRERVQKLMVRTQFFLEKSQRFIESEVIRRQKLAMEWIEIVLDGSILFLESVCNEA